MSMSILITDPIGGDPTFLTDFFQRKGHRVLVAPSEENWHGHATEADALIVNLAKVDAAALNGAPKLKVVARTGVGVNNIDLAAARARNIAVTNVPEYCVDEVSDHALSLMLALVRKITQANADIERGIFEQLRYRPIRRLNQMTLGLLGYGRLAQALARKARALGLGVLAHDPFLNSADVPLVELDRMLAEADIVSLHAPLLPETKGVIDSAALGRMKPGAILINTSRGELVDETALIEALDAGNLGGAGLDVFSFEPLPTNSPLKGRSNVLLTPHMAFYSEQSIVDLQRLAAEDALSVLTGQAPLNKVV